jgi:Ca2+-binding EF-hand superfamily protein
MLEIQKMFENYGIGIKLEDLRELFKIVDDDHDSYTNTRNT